MRSQETTGRTPMRVLIAGCGYVGEALARQLMDAGDQVWGLRRSVELLPAGIIPVAADLHRPETLRDLPADLDVSIYCAAAESWHDESYRRAYVEGPTHWLEALARNQTKPPRVVFTSSTGVYHQADGSWVDEDSATEPSGFSGRRMLEGEAVVRRWPGEAVILRLGGIYGPGREGLLDRVRRGDAVLAGPPPHYANRIHRDDAAAALAHLARLPSPEAIYLGVDEEPADRDLVLTYLAQRLDLPAPRRNSDPSSLAPRGNKRGSSARLRGSGFEFRYPSYRQGYDELIAQA